ncbi:MAG: hypothetical protein IIC73_06035 [Armatimonadetes bacterium]|nr:hypothetical protein [Armatimonadota bacterium]
MAVLFVDQDPAPLNLRPEHESIVRKLSDGTPKSWEEVCGGEVEVRFYIGRRPMDGFTSPATTFEVDEDEGGWLVDTRIVDLTSDDQVVIKIIELFANEIDQSVRTWAQGISYFPEKARSAGSWSLPETRACISGKIASNADWFIFLNETGREPRIHHLVIGAR